MSVSGLSAMVYWFAKSDGFSSFWSSGAHICFTSGGHGNLSIRRAYYVPFPVGILFPEWNHGEKLTSATPHLWP